MESRVIAMTVEKNGICPDELESLKTFSGKNAGICYLKETFEGAEALSAVKCAGRFITTSKIGHHSIADHAKIEVLFENCSKMFAMVMNSLQYYDTSEKSGRFTEMKGNSEEEVRLYEKWKGILKEKILGLRPDIDDVVLTEKLRNKVNSESVMVVQRHCDKYESELSEIISSSDATLPSSKLAQENARYMLSVFTRSTTFGYTTSLRQWNYIYDWTVKYLSKFESGVETYYFDSELRKDMECLKEFIENNLYVGNLRDTKNRCFDFLVTNSGVKDHPMKDYTFEEDDYVGESYIFSSLCSMVTVAQIERSRTLKYFMYIDVANPCKNGFFVPECIKCAGLEKEWLDDLSSVAHLIPQATLVWVVETGFIGDFVLKCEERLCGAAMYEAMKVTSHTAETMVEAYDNATGALRNYVNQFYNADKCRLRTKCEMLGGCKKPCIWGSEGALSRDF